MSDRLAIVVPARNEEARLPALLTLLDGPLDAVAAAAGFELTEIIVADDHSIDGTAEIVSAWAERDARVRLVAVTEGAGKGAAVRAGMLEAVSPWALLMDADVSTPVDELAALARAVRAGAHVAVGSRGLDESEILVRQPRHRERAGRMFNSLVRMLTGLGVRDTQCGFKLFQLGSTRVLFEHQRIDGFAFDVELLVAARRRRLTVAEVPVRWHDDPRTTVRLLEASLQMAWDLVRVAVRDLATRPVPTGGTLVAPDFRLGSVTPPQPAAKPVETRG